jgi:hypothetical protein
VTVVFQMNETRLRERKEIQISQLEYELEQRLKAENWDFSAPDLSFSLSQENSLPLHLKGFKYVEMSRSTVTIPLIVVENETKLEIRDCLIRSLKIELPSSEDNSKSIIIKS